MFPKTDFVACEISSPPKILAGETAMSNSDLIDDRFSPVGQARSLERNYVTAHPSYLKTLGQAHSSWIFGAIAELVDNARDAKATK